MPAAEYAHYGLALQYYTHFTYAGGWAHIRPHLDVAIACD